MKTQDRKTLKIFLWKQINGYVKGWICKKAKQSFINDENNSAFLDN